MISVKTIVGIRLAYSGLYQALFRSAYRHNQGVRSGMKLCTLPNVLESEQT